MPGKNGNSLDRTEMDMTSNPKVPPNKRSSRFLTIFRTILGLMILVAPLFACARVKGSAETGPAILLAVNQGEAALGVVDPRAGKQVATIAEGGVTGHEVATSFDVKLSYVPIYGDSSVGDPGTNGRELVVIDIAARKVVNRFD